MPNITTFDTSAPYIFLPIFVIMNNKRYEFDAILDTGAPLTEFSDRALEYSGFFVATRNISLKEGLQTQKYGKITLPRIQICGHEIEKLEVFVSHFEKSWGIDALIGLDFFRRFRIEIDYSKGVLISDFFTNYAKESYLNPVP